MKEFPTDPLAHELLAKRALYLGFPELAIPAFEKANPGYELGLAGVRWHDAGDALQANRWVDRLLEADPYDLHALNWKVWLAERHGTPEEAQITSAQASIVATSPERPANPVQLRFEPANPRLNSETSVESDGVTVYDHSRFRVTMTNTSRRNVVVDSVRLTSRGGNAGERLGDVKDYWRYSTAERRLAPGESLHFDKLWGFTLDTEHPYVRYTFRTCWRRARRDDSAMPRTVGRRVSLTPRVTSGTYGSASASRPTCSERNARRGRSPAARFNARTVSRPARGIQRRMLFSAERVGDVVVLEEVLPVPLAGEGDVRLQRQPGACRSFPAAGGCR